MTPDKNVKPFMKGEVLTGNRVDQLRQPVASLLRTAGMDAPESPTRNGVPFVPVELSQNTGSQGGILGGKAHWPPVYPTDGSSDLMLSNLGATSIVAGGAELDDVEIWDLSFLQNARLGFHAGYNASGKPIVIVDSGTDSGCAWQYQAKYAVAANVMACGFMRAHPVID